MSNKLFVFGDSFSYHYKLNYNDGWPDLLSKRFRYELVLMSSPGSSNYQIFHRILNNLSKVNKKDIVIFNLTWSDRYFIPVTEEGIIGNDIRLAKESDNYEKLSMLERWFDENVSHQELIKFNSNTLSTYLWLLENLNINFYYWNVGDAMIKDETNKFISPPSGETTSFFYDWIENDKSMWLDEQEPHLGTLGHQKICDYFFNFITKDKNE